jgi:hypothetical protein
MFNRLGFYNRPFNPLYRVLNVNLELVWQDVRNNPNKPARIIPNHTLKRRAAVLLPLGINISNKSLAKLVA